MTPPITFLKGEEGKAHLWIPFILLSCLVPTLSLPRLPIHLRLTASLIPGEKPGAGIFSSISSIFSSISSIFSILSSRAVVKQERLQDVVGSYRYWVNNYLDHKYRPWPVNQIISSAKEKIGEETEYSVLGKNCEHFVTLRRYGRVCSRQARPSLG